MTGVTITMTFCIFAKNILYICSSLQSPMGCGDPPERPPAPRSLTRAPEFAHLATRVSDPEAATWALLDARRGLDCFAIALAGHAESARGRFGVFDSFDYVCFFLILVDSF